MISILNILRVITKTLAAHSRALIIFSIYGSLLASFPASVAVAQPASQERVLLAEILQTYRSISPDFAIKDQLKLYENALEKYEKLITDYPTSDIGLQLLGNGVYGQLDFNQFRSEYIKKAADYNDKICASTPSLVCTGYVSLKDGQSLCDSAKTSDQIVSAADSFANAVMIFQKQKETKGLVILTLDAFRACSSHAKIAISQTDKDLLNSRIIPALLAVGQKSRVTGLIEQMQTPFLKFQGILQLKNHSGEKYDSAFYDRLDRYIDENIPDDFDEYLAHIMLSTETMANSPDHVDASIVKLEVPTLPHWERDSKSPPDPCKNIALGSYTFDLLVRYIDTVRKLPTTKDSYMNNITSSVKKGFMTRDYNLGCWRRYNKAAYDLGLYMIGLDMYVGITNPARATRPQSVVRHVKMNRPDSDGLFSWYLQSFPVASEELPELDAMIKKFGGGPSSKFALFKKYVDFGKVCEASKIMLSELRNTPFAQDSTAYFASNPQSAAGANCGDSSLELLLSK